MNIKQISTWLRNTGTVVTLVATSTAATGMLAPVASAAGFTTYDLISLPEGEIDVVGKDCLDASQCVDPSTLPLIQSIETLVDESTGSKSRLLVDDLSTGNLYTNGTETVQFFERDRGTNPGGGLWYRPSTDEENGQLEVGTYKFTFSQTLDELDIHLFDIDFAVDQTKVLAVNGDASLGRSYAPNGNQGLTIDTFEDVKSITIKLGYDIPGDVTGDGVDFRLFARLEDPMVDIPEPSTAVGLGAVAAIGALGLRKGKNKKA